MTTKEKLKILRSEMQAQNINAFIVYSADAHMSEYLPKNWREREWISGFTGSAGFVVITKDEAGLWTDGRYFTQAEIELKNSGIDLYKEGVENTPDYANWLLEKLPEGATVAVNSLATSHANWEILSQKLSSKNIKLIDNSLLKNIWTNRETPNSKYIFVHPLDRAGQSVTQKLNAIRQKMDEQKASVHIIASLDDVAWTLNLRGNDVAYNPVFLGYIVLTKNESILFVDLEKLSIDVKKHLDEAQVKIRTYENFFPYLKQFNNETILVSPNTNQSIFEHLKDNTFIKNPAPGNLMKATKNETELEGFRKVMERDGVAMVKFLYWLTHNVDKEPMTEYSVGEKLRDFRAEGENFVGESFGSIIGYKDSGAIMHYSAKKDDCKDITNDGSILVDSGGQYFEGTTDITRTLALGNVSEEFKKNATLVLQGMIQLSMAKFPKGTKGVQLDALARLPLWMHGKDYNHGTGHGVGSFMNVHEPPQNIRKDLNPQELLPGMVLSNEPGFYLVGQYGIRHENLVAVKEVGTTDFGTFYEFETLTFCPFFKDIIVIEMLSKVEIDWLNNYHKQCDSKIAKHLEGDVLTWFLDLISPI